MLQGPACGVGPVSRAPVEIALSVEFHDPPPLLTGLFMAEILNRIWVPVFTI